MPTLPTLKQLQYLVALSEQLNFTRAAESCHVTQSTLSAGLGELEAALDTRLVERTRQTVLMTPMGHEVAGRARAILTSAKELVELTAGARTPMTGQLRLGIIPTIAPFLLPSAMECIRERHPRLQLVLREDTTANLLKRLENGQLDLALIALPYDTTTLRVEALFEEALWIVGRPDAPELAAPRGTASNSLSDRLLLLEEGHCLREHALYACGNTAYKSPGAMEATSLLTLVQMIESGLGIGLLPEMAIRSGLADSPGLIARPLKKPAPTRTIALVARRTSTRQYELNALAEVFRLVGTRKQDQASPATL